MSPSHQDQAQDQAQAPFIEIRDFKLESIRKDKADPEKGEQPSESGRRAEALYHSCELSAQRGEVVLLLGPSGAGKSLLTNFLLNITSPLSETLLMERGARHASPSILVRLDERTEVEVLADAYPEELRGRVGVMFQSLALLEDLTLEQNLSWG